MFELSRIKKLKIYFTAAAEIFLETKKFMLDVREVMKKLPNSIKLN
jgi:hypothetical protein